MKQVQITVKPNDKAPVINRDIYSHFSEHLGHCIYGGLWVGEDSSIPNTRGIRNDVVAALRELNLPTLRWPGGCFADEYHWMDGIGPRESRPSMYNSHWGGVVENNHFGTHEFFDLCEQIGCEAYVCGNVGSGTVREMSEWVEYITSPAQSPMADLRRKNGRNEPWKLKYFGVGNESWGCGGHMRPEYYADEYRRYNTFVRTYGPNKIQRIACGANTADYNWTEILMERAHNHMDGLALHYYTLLGGHWPPSGSALNFDEKDFRSTLRAALHMDELITKHSAIMDKHDPEKRVNLVVDEWGTWHPVEPGTNPGFLFQQNTMRDALVASLHFDLFHRHADRVRMANIAQMVNVLQAVVLTKDDQMLLTPTYWAFSLYKAHQDAQHIPLSITADPYTGEGGDLPSISATASRKDNVLTVSLSCLDPHEGRTVSVCDLPSGVKVTNARVLTASKMQAHNTFDNPEVVKPKSIETRHQGTSLDIELPPLSIATILFES